MVVVAPYGVLATPCSVLANLQVAAVVNHPPKHVASVRFGPGKSEELTSIVLMVVGIPGYTYIRCIYIYILKDYCTHCPSFHI